MLPSLMKQVHQLDKKQLRQDIMRARQTLSPEVRRNASAAIAARLIESTEFEQARTVHCFVSLSDEVHTEAIFQACWAGAKKTYVPFQTQQDHLGTALRNPGDKLAPGVFNVPEPLPENRGAVDLATLDLILVPGLAFDRAGNRLGYGKGYYDRFLADLTGAVLGPAAGSAAIKPHVIALAFGLQIVDNVPSEDWDIPVHSIITELERIDVGTRREFLAG